MAHPFESKLFFAIAAFLVGAGVVYWIFADEQSGVVLLVAGGIFAGIVGVFVGRHQEATLLDVERQEWGPDSAHTDEPEGDPLYLPHGSIWPAVMAAGVTLILTGFAAGLWILIPGVLLFIPGVAGFVAEGRARRG